MTNSVVLGEELPGRRPDHAVLGQHPAKRIHLICSWCRATGAGVAVSEGKQVNEMWLEGQGCRLSCSACNCEL